MPTHWESSTRPLFVRTVVVNGSRHAILTQEDPLGHNTPTAVTKNSRPSSARSVNSSTTSDTSSAHAPDIEEGPSGKKENDLPNIEKGGKKCPRDLQDCLVKLRLVLATQETRKVVKTGRKQTTETENKKRKRTSKCNNGKKACDWHEPTQEPNAPDSPERNEDTSDLQPPFKYDNNHNITVASFFTSQPRTGQYCHQNEDKDVERISGHSCSIAGSSIASTLGMSSEYDVPWNSVSAESYFTRPFYNRLSERVLQWLDLANKKNPKNSETHSTNKTEGNSQLKLGEGKSATKQVKRVLSHRESSEDNSEEVRTEEDVDTALSKEFPKFSQELNRLHYLKAAIPVKKDEYASQLQESIAQSFTTIVSIRSGKYAEKPKQKDVPCKPARKGYLTRQVRLDESSEEDEVRNHEKTHSVADRRNGFLQRNTIFSKTLDSKTLFIRQDSQENCSSSNLSSQLHNRIPWIRDRKWPPEKEIGKPQLHIFIPALPDENEPISDSASVSSES